MKRKIVRVGASLCILLPKDVIRSMQWDFGQEIDLLLDEENEVVVLRNPRKAKTKKQTFFEDYESFETDYGQALEEIDKLKQS